jgi:hypothetical protein
MNIERFEDFMKTTGSDPLTVRVTPRTTKFSLAANYDLELVPQLAGYPIDEVYGKFPTDGVSGGRPRYLATPLSEADLRGYIRLLERHGIAFNYLLNGACFGNREWTRPWQKKVTALLTKLGEWGVRRVTVSTPFLLELVKRRFPELKVESEFMPRWTRPGARASGKNSGRMPSCWRASRSTGTFAVWRPFARRSVAIWN